MNKNLAENVAQSTSNIANQILDNVDSATNASRDLVNQGARAAQSMIEKGVDSINQAQDLTCKYYAEYANTISKCLREKPVQSMFVIAASGALLALLLSNNKDKR